VTSQGSPSSSAWRGKLRNLFAKVTQLGRSSARRPRKVRFQPEADVFEFERQLLGSGGVPENDTASLGLGFTLVNSYTLPLAEKGNKDEYAATGYLDLETRIGLLSSWEKPKALQMKMQRQVGPELEELRRKRSETASSPKDQRFMPASLEEAVELGQTDEEVARKALGKALQHRPGRSAAIVIFSPGGDDMTLASPKGIAKKKRRHSI